MSLLSFPSILRTKAGRRRTASREGVTDDHPAAGWFLFQYVCYLALLAVPIWWLWSNLLTQWLPPIDYPTALGIVVVLKLLRG